MKKLSVIFISILLSLNASAQQKEIKEEEKEPKEHEPVKAKMEEARKLLKEKKYFDSAASLQAAINEVNNLIGKEILKSMPEEINGIKAQVEQDNTMSIGSMLGAGMTVTRVYMNDEGVMLNMTISPQTPQSESVETFLENPEVYGAESDAGKSVKIGDHKALMKFENNPDEKIAYMQIPFNDALIVITGDGIKNEEDFVKFASGIDFAKLAKTVGEKKSGSKKMYDVSNEDDSQEDSVDDGE